MDELYGCLADDSQCTRSVDDYMDDPALQLEKIDILAYHAWLNGPAASAPFATFVILHNLVTSSVNQKFVRHGAAQYACVLSAAHELKTTRMSTSKLDFDEYYQVATPNPPQGSLPGIGRHRLINCSI